MAAALRREIKNDDSGRGKDAGTKQEEEMVVNVADDGIAVVVVVVAVVFNRGKKEMRKEVRMYAANVEVALRGLLSMDTASSEVGDPKSIRG